MRNRIKPLLLAAAGMIASVGLLMAGSVQPASAASAAAPVSLPIGSYYQMVVDAAHGQIFISQGSSSQNGILVTDLSGQVITTITGQSGVVGIALSPDGSTLYAALSTGDAVTAISTATLTQTASYPLPGGDSPFNVAVQSGNIWVSYDTGAAFAAAIGFFDPSAPSPSLQTPAAMGGWSSAPQLAADPQDTGVLVAAGPGTSASGLASYDTAANPVTTLAGSPTGPAVCGNEQDLAVAPGGSEFAVACHDPGTVDHVYSTASLSVLRSLGSPTSPAFPVAISYDAAGDIAAGTTNNVPSPDLYVYPPGGTTALNTYTLYSLSTLGGILQPRGLAWAPDGSQVFGVLSRITSFALAVITNPTAPRLDPTTTILSCQPGTVAIGQATSCTAIVTDTTPGATPPAGEVSFTSDTTGGSLSSNSCALSPGSTIGQASCAVSYTPGQTGSGTQTISASYGGDGSHAASSGQAALTVTLRATTTVLTCQRSLLVLQKCTAVVSDTSPGSATAPTGTVGFSSSGRGVFSATQCTLSGNGTSASCTVFFRTPAGVPFKGQTIVASYGGDSTHQSSTGSTTLP
jgi:YVTN family beta-propeller protein